MKFESKVTVVGMKSSKGTLDNGTAYDSTKAYVLQKLDESRPNMRGQTAEAFNFGTAEEFEKFKSVPFPFEAVAEMELVSNGSSTKTVMRSLRPIADQPIPTKRAGV